jgi:hypothetical protein
VNSSDLSQRVATRRQKPARLLILAVSQSRGFSVSRFCGFSVLRCIGSAVHRFCWLAPGDALLSPLSFRASTYLQRVERRRL